MYSYCPLSVLIPVCHMMRLYLIIVIPCTHVSDATATKTHYKIMGFAGKQCM